MSARRRDGSAYHLSRRYPGASKEMGEPSFAFLSTNCASSNCDRTCPRTQESREGLRAADVVVVTGLAPLGDLP